MGTTIALWNVIGKAEYIFLIRIIPLQRYFNTNPILFSTEINNTGMNRGFIAV